jgi:hypothetical protein
VDDRQRIRLRGAGRGDAARIILVPGFISG